MEPTDDQPEQIAEMKAEFGRRQDAYVRYLAEIAGVAGPARAEAWLAYVASDMDCFGDQEALVYLASRGYDCSEQVRKICCIWRLAAQAVKERFAAGIEIVDLGTGQVEHRDRTPDTDASDVRRVSSLVLGNFWGGRDDQEDSIDATMLRTASWCGIGGFEEWWDRLVTEHHEAVVHGGFDPTVWCGWLFNMCRSDCAVGRMKPTLVRDLESAETPYRGISPPWSIEADAGIGAGSHWRPVDHIVYASTLLFADGRLRAEKPGSALSAPAIELLLQHQDAAGWWPCWADEREPSVYATAVALHALVRRQAPGLELACTLAREWLWAVQQPDGCWHDRRCPDGTHLTVLCLDAVQLSQGRTPVTFAVPGTSAAAATCVGKAEPRRFALALTFAGEDRGFVEDVATVLAASRGRDRVFYDRWHEAELARLNLDLYLQTIYHEQADTVVVFVSEGYDRKEWCGLEWRAVRDLIKTGRADDVVLVRLDDTALPGTFSVDGRIDVAGRSPAEIATLVLQRATSGPGEPPGS